MFWLVLAAVSCRQRVARAPLLLHMWSTWGRGVIGPRTIAIVYGLQMPSSVAVPSGGAARWGVGVRWIA